MFCKVRLMCFCWWSMVLMVHGYWMLVAAASFGVWVAYLLSVLDWFLPSVSLAWTCVFLPRFQVWIHPWMSPPMLSMSIHAPGCLIFQIPSGILEANRFALFVIAPHQNLHILLVQSEPIVLLQMFPKSSVALLPGMLCNHCHHWLALPSRWKDTNTTR